MTNLDKTMLDVIAYAEGTFGISNNGYDVLFNDSKVIGQSRIIKGWTENTTIKHGLDDWAVRLKDGSITTAAGRYQFTKGTWIDWNNKNNATMSKDNQDNACIALLSKRLGTDYGRKITSEDDMSNIADKLKGTWASFKTKSAKDLYSLYKRALVKYDPNA